MKEKIAMVKHGYYDEWNVHNCKAKVVYDEIQDEPVMEVLSQNLVSKDRHHRNQIGDQRSEKDNGNGDTFDDGHH